MKLKKYGLFQASTIKVDVNTFYYLYRRLFAIAYNVITLILVFFIIVKIIILISILSYSMKTTIIVVMSLRESELNIFTPKIYIIQFLNIGSQYRSRLESTAIKTINNLFFIHYSLATHNINYDCTYGFKKKLACIRSVYTHGNTTSFIIFQGC